MIEYVLHILTLGGIFAILAISLDLAVGHTGLLSLAHAVFFGIGAYSSAITTTHLALPFTGSVVVGIIVAAVTAAAVFSLTSSLKDDTFAVASLCVQMMGFSVLNNWLDVTRGPLGIASIPRAEILGWHITSPLSHVLLVLILVLATVWFAWSITRSPFGRVLRVIREDELLAASIGKNTARYKLIILVISAAIASVAGSLYAQYVTYIDPTSFTIMESVLVLGMVILGGAGSRLGPLIGAVVLILVPELLRFIGLPTSAAAHLRQILYGAILVALMLWRPRGLTGVYEFRGAKDR